MCFLLLFLPKSLFFIGNLLETKSITNYMVNNSPVKTPDSFKSPCGVIMIYKSFEDIVKDYMKWIAIPRS